MLLQRHKEAQIVVPPAPVKEIEINDYPIPFSEDEAEAESGAERTYTKTEINRMNVAELREVAALVGIENADEESGANLKKSLISFFGL